MPKEPDQREFIQSLERGLAVILAFSDHHPSLTLSRCAELTGLSKPTVRRVLLTLQHLGYVRSEGRLFALTPRVLALGYAYLSSLNLPVIAQPSMEELVAATREPCTLATLDDTDVVYVTRVLTHRRPGATLATGTRLPAHATAMGHVLLADLSQAELDHYLSRAELLPLTARTVRTPGELLGRLDTARAQGWAMVEQELEEGLRSVAAPVRGADGRVIAALGMSASVATADAETMRERFAPLLVRAAAAISERLGADFGPAGTRPAVAARPR
ncbi:IclR family transcriptional regulator domain-containing protein [Pseudonocardia xinjiangensis]|uniref:IclR family transcriptional regulator domain-containing protein n=1 Tax=Pseudonocardia xinjiangensis TaxID=75289 RepID=UPI003D924406